MSGRMGNERITVLNLTVQKVDVEQGLLLIAALSRAPITASCSSYRGDQRRLNASQGWCK